MMLHFKRLGKQLAKDDKGYTLLELLVVLVILSLIVGLAGPAILSQFGTAKSKTAGIEVERIVTSLEFYRVDVGSFPSQDEGLGALLTTSETGTGWNGPYIEKESQLIDPWGNPYIYVISEDGDTVEVKSLGADAAENGTGEDADVSSLD